MDPEYRIARSKRARALLADSDVIGALDEIERELFEEWKSLAWDEKARAECMRAEYRGLLRVRGKLQQWSDELLRFEQPR